MNNLFGKSPIEQLRDSQYSTESHTFSKGVIAAYYNLLEYPSEVTEEVIRVKRRKDFVNFYIKPYTAFLINEKATVYSLIPTQQTKVKTKEVIYDLEKIFTNPAKQIRRGMTLTTRPGIQIRPITSTNREFIEEIYNEWTQHKLEDKKTFRIAFTPKRYLRSFQLVDKGFQIIELVVYVRGEPYGILAFEKQGDIAFELAFMSRFWRKDLKLINDLNECILVNCFFYLYNTYNIKRINTGPTAGIKGLKVFKAKMPFDELTIYSN